MKAVVLHPNKQPELHDFQGDGYDGIKQALAEGHLEVLCLRHDVVCYIDEDGKAKNLERNIHATFVVELMLLQDGRQMLPGDYISGTAVFIGATADGEEADLPEDVIRMHFPSVL